MASDPKCESAIEVVEYLEKLASEKYSIRIQSVDGRLFVFASHASRSNRSGNGRSLARCVNMMEENGKEEPNAGNGRE